MNTHRGTIGTRWRNSNYGVPSPVERRGDRRIVDCGLFLFQDGGNLPSEIGQYKKEPCYPSLLQTNLCFKLIPQHTEKPPVSVLPQDTSRYKGFEQKPSSTMAPTPIQENLVESNKKYAASFTQGHLALPPAKKYAVCTTPLFPFHPVPLPANPYRYSDLYGRPYRPRICLWNFPRRRPRNPQRWCLRERRPPLPRHLGATSRHGGNPPHKAHWLWDVDV